mmetsp:Transcript_66936/g.215776  ORF Transcript_66936/g.215776 Transcript_66936/m.215776 type:complete len:277 (-) Transcript_66936:205-1035(-)
MHMMFRSETSMTRPLLHVLVTSWPCFTLVHSFTGTMAFAGPSLHLLPAPLAADRVTTIAPQSARCLPPPGVVASPRNEFGVPGAERRGATPVLKARPGVAPPADARLLGREGPRWPSGTLLAARRLTAEPPEVGAYALRNGSSRVSMPMSSRPRRKSCMYAVARSCEAAIGPMGGAKAEAPPTALAPRGRPYFLSYFWCKASSSFMPPAAVTPPALRSGRPASELWPLATGNAASPASGPAPAGSPVPASSQGPCQGTKSGLRLSSWVPSGAWSGK